MTEKVIDYDMLKKDLIIVNATVGGVAIIMFICMVLQRQDILPNFPCAVHELLHIYCPGCGGTRAIFAMLQGRFLMSLYCNPAVMLGVLLVLHYEIGVIITVMKKNGKRYYCNNIILLIIYLIVVGVYSVVRNYLLVSFGIDMLNDFML